MKRKNTQTKEYNGNSPTKKQRYEDNEDNEDIPLLQLDMYHLALTFMKCREKPIDPMDASDEISSEMAIHAHFGSDIKDSYPKEQIKRIVGTLDEGKGYSMLTDILEKEFNVTKSEISTELLDIWQFVDIYRDYLSGDEAILTVEDLLSRLNITN